MRRIIRLWSIGNALIARKWYMFVHRNEQLSPLTANGSRGCISLVAVASGDSRYGTFKVRAIFYDELQQISLLTERKFADAIEKSFND